MRFLEQIVSSFGAFYLCYIGTGKNRHHIREREYKVHVWHQFINLKGFGVIGGGFGWVGIYFVRISMHVHCAHCGIEIHAKINKMQKLNIRQSDPHVNSI